MSGRLGAPEPERFIPPAQLPAGVSLYEVLATHLHKQIARNAYPPGSRLPSVRVLAERSQVSESTARAALRELVAARVVEVKDRAGHIVIGTQGRHGTPPVPVDPYSQETVQDPDEEHPPIPAAGRDLPPPAPRDIPLSGDISPSGSHVRNVWVRPEQPTPDVAAALHLTPGSGHVIARHQVIADSIGNGLEVRSNFLPAAVAEGTLLAKHYILTGPWPALIAQHTGHQPRSANATVHSRPSLEWEAQALRIPPHAHVTVRETVLYADNGQRQPLDLTRSVWPAAIARVTTTYPVTL